MMPIFVRIYHWYSLPLVVILRFITFFGLFFFIGQQAIISIFPRGLLIYLFLFLIWEIYFRYRISIITPQKKIIDESADIYQSFTIASLEKLVFYTDTKRLVKDILNTRSVQFILHKADMVNADIQLFVIPTEALAQKAYEIAKKVDGTYVTLLDIFTAYLFLTEGQTHLLFSKKIKEEEFLHLLYWARIEFSAEEIAQKVKVTFWGQGIGEDWTTGWTIETKRYISDITAEVLQDRPSLLGRDKEYEQLVQGLSQPSRNNVLLVGEVGAGKTSLVEELAIHSFIGTISGRLYHNRIYQLQVSALVAGIRDIGILETRLNSILEELRHAGNIILFIPEVQNILGSSSFNIDLTSVMLPILKKGGIPIIATALPGIYQTVIQSNQSFADLFQVVHLDEPSREEAIPMLLEKANEIERVNHVNITYKAIVASVDLAKRYIQNKVLPGSAVTLLSSSTANVASEKKQLVEEADIVAKIESLTHISIATPGSTETSLLLHLEEKLHERIIGQLEAVNSIAQAIRRVRTGLSASTRPISFLFLGPTGVGKTETAKALGQIYFGGEDKILRLDMSEYTSADSIDRLLGSAPGKGNEKGELTEKVYEHPFSLILLDEFEKAHSEILNLFLQVLEDARLTDNHGKTVSFANTIIIATSNAGALYIQEQLKAGKQLDSSFHQNVLQEIENEHLFKPELLNRFDGVIIFKSLAPEDIQKIAGLYLTELQKQLLSQDVEIVFDDKITQLVSQAGFDSQFGARPLRRFIQDKIEDAIAKELLEGKIERGSHVKVSADEHNVVTFSVL